MSRGEGRFWGWFVVRLAGVAAAGLLLVLVFREVMVPILKGDVERLQREHAPR